MSRGIMRTSNELRFALSWNKWIVKRKILCASHQQIISFHSRSSTRNPMRSSASENANLENATSVELSGNKRYVSIRIDGGESLRFHAIWMRHNCHCENCKQPHSGQKLIEVSKLQPVYTVKSVQLDSTNRMLNVTWNEEFHTTRLPLEFLRDNEYSSETLEKRLSAITPVPILNSVVPRVRYQEFAIEENLFRWMKLINEYGLCVIENVPIVDGMVKKVAEMIWPVQNTIYGEMWDVKSDPQPINVAYTDAKLDFHMDLAYYESPPGIQFLHCLQFDDRVVGGESQFVDAWQVAESMRASHPEEFSVLTKVPATFQKIHFNRSHPVNMRYRRPHISVDPTGRINAVTWAPAFEGPLAVSDNLVESYYKAHRIFAKLLTDSPTNVQFRLVPGELICFNNRRVLHARNGFEQNDGGVRHLQGCYVNIDEFKSRLQILSDKFDKGSIVKHVMNQSWV